MKKNTLLFQSILCSILLPASLLIACTGGDKKANTAASITDTVATIPAENTTVAADTSKLAFDINSIPVTTKDMGTFPYLNAPENYKYNDITKSDLKTVHFAVNGKLIPVEGKTFSTNIYKLNENGSESTFNATIVQRAYDKAVKDLGGVKLPGTPVPQAEVNRVGPKVLDEEGNHAYSIIGPDDYTLSHLNTYVIRTAKSEVWIELSFYQNGAYIHILEKPKS
ncbi:hypothetical protein H9X96_12660 [Pedobacter sp. N36a]|uniref:hypothetical protein n=1 Tax=Pedobacter sp. N36a TaxID=2767996 RepID=UPI001656F781|nr:hypothetical protein [Pedobacter sp. N36a]MBC8986631.1 hypothetical protein [Pedobacter sp. N36a]